MSKVGRHGRGSSPPPEQHSAEEDFGPHEQPTRPVQASPTPGAAFPSEGPTLPRTARDAGLRDPRDQVTKPARPARGSPEPQTGRRALSPDAEFEHPSQRVTAPPPPGKGQLAKGQLGQGQLGQAKSTSARRDVVTDPAPADHAEDDDIFDRPTLDVVDDTNELLGIGYTPRRPPSPSPTGLEPTGLELGIIPSQLPTAPPPEEFQLDLRNVQRVPSQGSLDSFLEEPRHEELRVPPHGSLSARGNSQDARPPRISTPPGSSPVRDMNDRFAMGDFSGALEKARLILEEDPLDREARSMAAKCEDVLLDMYSSRIAGMQRTVRTVMGSDQIRWLSLDHRAGFLLSLIDGHSSVDDLLDLCGMPRLEALRLICSLVDQRVIELS